MLSLTLHIVQVLGEWQVRATLCRDLGAGTEPELSWGSSSLPLTGLEWDSDDLTAVLSAVSRWSGMTMEGTALKRLD
jgi:hypothetical protein